METRPRITPVRGTSSESALGYGASHQFPSSTNVGPRISWVWTLCYIVFLGCGTPDQSPKGVGLRAIVCSLGVGPQISLPRVWGFELLCVPWMWDPRSVSQGCGALSYCVFPWMWDPGSVCPWVWGLEPVRPWVPTLMSPPITAACSGVFFSWFNFANSSHLVAHPFFQLRNTRNNNFKHYAE